MTPGAATDALDPATRSRTTTEAAIRPAAGGTKETEPGTDLRPAQVRSFLGQLQSARQGLPVSATSSGSSLE